MVKVYMTEFRYGDTVPDTNAIKEFSNFDKLMDWIDGLDNTVDKSKTHILDKFNGYYGGSIEVSIRTTTWGAIYIYRITRVETEEGIHYDQKISGKKCSVELANAIDKFIQKVTAPKKVLF